MSKRTRFAHSPMPVSDILPFCSGEEAWFWFIRCQQLRNEGGRPTTASNTPVRPCDPDDIYCAVRSLHQQRFLTAAHLRTLSQYGLAERSPDPRCSEEVRSARLWEEALVHLEQDLRHKGIVA